MFRHRGVPSRLPGSGFQFKIRRASKKGATPLVERKRHADRKARDREADQGFLMALWGAYREDPFERGDLDAGRLSWLVGREIIPADEDFDPACYGARLRIDANAARAAFPEIFESS